MTTSAPNTIVPKIQVPSLDVLVYLDALAKQIAFDTAASDSDIGEFSSGTASRRNAKLFVVGIIPPDVPVNYVPFQKVSTAVPPAVSTTPSTTGTAGLVSQVPSVGNGGEQPRAYQSFSASDLRQALYNGYVNATGQAPTEATLSLLYAQTLTENGAGNNPNTISATNFNLGSTHAYGQTIGFFDDNNVNNDAPGFVPPSSGTYYIWRDSTKGFESDTTTPRPGSRAFKVAFNSFNNLQDGANFQVANIIRGWPGVANAQTSQEFVDATKPIPGPRPTAANPDAPGRAGYFGLDPAEYQKALDSKLAGYNQRFGDSPLGSTGSPQTSLSTPDNMAPAVMTSGVITDYESADPLATRLGRTVQASQDGDRLKSAQDTTSALQAQIQTLNDMPALLMMINPSEFTRDYEYSADDSPKTRQGNIVHLWLERPLSISGNGVSAAQYVMDSGSNGGLSNFNRIQSIAYRNLLSLVMIYKNNGSIFTGTEVPGSVGVLMLGISLYIYYDDHMYIGSFDEFSVDDDADKPYNLSYSFKFNVRYDIEMDGMNQINDIAVAATQPGFNRTVISSFASPASSVSFVGQSPTGAAGI